jgi:hypothetical protein
MTKFTNRLDIYGRAECPKCGNYVETAFARIHDLNDLVCRDHPGHPLFIEDGEVRRGGTQREVSTATPHPSR